MVTGRRVLRRYLLESLLGSRERTKRAIDMGAELPTLWVENEQGDRYIPDFEANEGIPKGFIYQFSRFPRTLTETALRSITEEEVKACPHEQTRPDTDLIEGLVGRICTGCGGSQIKKVSEPWPEEWTSGGSRPFFTSSSSWPTSLVLAMTRPTPEEISTATARGHTIKPMNMERAILFAATSCERCLNVLLWRHGCDDGYEEGSTEWVKANTSCELCKTEFPPKPPTGPMITPAVQASRHARAS